MALGDSAKSEFLFDRRKPCQHSKPASPASHAKHLLPSVTIRYIPSPRGLVVSVRERRNFYGDDFCPFQLTANHYGRISYAHHNKHHLGNRIRHDGLLGVRRSSIYLFVGSWFVWRSEEHTSELQSLVNLVCRLLLEKKNNFILVIRSEAITYL